MDQNNELLRVTMEGEEFQRSARSFESKNPKIIQWVIKYSQGLVKNENQANYVLIGFVGVVITISFFLFLGGKSDKSHWNNPDPAKQNVLN